MIAGPGVHVVQPPFTIVPVEDRGDCDAGSVADSEIHRKITNVPFAVAIPVLTGWDLSYACNDENVEEIGIWIDDFTYVGPGAAGNGTLEYGLKAVLHDEGRDENAVFRHRIGVLGFERVPAAP